MPFMSNEQPELTEKYRPDSVDQVFGQSDAVALLSGYMLYNKLPHVILFTGPSGCGKTTFGRIIKRYLGIEGSGDFKEINMADDRGIDTVRDIRSRINTTGLTNKAGNRLILLDEVHQATKDAQTALLKVLEDTPKHIYFVLCTTDPKKLLNTIITRSTEIKVKRLSDDDIMELTTQIAAAENIQLSDNCKRRIAEVADGSARKALKILEAISVIDNEAQRLDIIQSSESKQQAIELCRLMFRKSSFKDAAKIVKALDDEPEQVRQLILSYATTVCLSGGGPYQTAAKILDCFRDNYHYNGKAGLTMSIFEFYHS